MYRVMLNISLRRHQRENQWIYKPMLATGWLKKRSTPDCGVIPISSSLRHSTAHCLFGVLYFVYLTAAVIVLVNAPFTFISKLLGRNCSRFSHLRSKKKSSKEKQVEIKQSLIVATVTSSCSFSSRPHLFHHHSHRIPTEINWLIYLTKRYERQNAGRLAAKIRGRRLGETWWTNDSHLIALSFSSTDSQGFRSSLNSRSSRKK